MSTANVTVVEPAWVDDRGVDVPDWTDTTETVEVWRSVTPMTATEATDMGRQGIVTDKRGSGPFDTVLTAKCHAIIGGITYEVVSVQPWPSITGGLAHTEAVFSQVEG